MLKMPFIVSGAISLFFSIQTFASIGLDLAGYSIGTAQDEYVVFFDNNNNGQVDALSYSARSANMFYGINNGFAIDYQELVTSQSFKDGNNIIVADMNGDGLKDIISYPFNIMINNGAGHYLRQQQVLPWSAYGDFVQIQALDIDGNSQLDIALTTAYRLTDSYSGSLYIFKNVSYNPNRPDNGFFDYESIQELDLNAAPFAGNISSLKPNGIVTGDLNGDQTDDIIFVNSSKGMGLESNSVIALNNGSGALSFKQSFSSAADVAMGDLDNDGDLDMYVARSSNQVDEVWLNDGHGNFNKSAHTFDAYDSTDASIADIDNDGDLDIIVAASNASEGQPHTIWFNDGSANFSQERLRFGTSVKTTSLTVFDVDLDGDQDIVTLGPAIYNTYSQTYVSTNRVWLNSLYTANREIDQESYQAAFDEGVAFCRDNPSNLNLFTLSEVEQLIAEEYSAGIQACIDDPASFGLFDQSDINQATIDGIQSCIDDPSSCNLYNQANLDSQYANGYNDGERNGQQQCINDPTSCNLFDQNDLDQQRSTGYSEGWREGSSFGHILGQQYCKNNPGRCNLYSKANLDARYNDGYQTGKNQGFNEGKAFCISFPSACNLFDQVDLEAANQSGFESGKQFCVDNPNNCGLYNDDMLSAINQSLIQQIAADLPKGQLKSICKKNPANPICTLTEVKVKKVKVKKGKKAAKDKGKKA